MKFFNIHTWTNHYFQLSESGKLTMILFIALAVRLIAAWFSQGYAMQDDHILVVDKPASWASGYDPGAWFPYAQQKLIDQGKREAVGAEGHSMFYYGVQFVFFKTMNTLGIENPKVQMLINRIFHALWGVLLIYLSFHLTCMISSTKNAFTVAWVLALGWVFPYLSVRNLIEIVCIPFMIAAFIFSLKGMRRKTLQFGILAGACIAFAFSIRFQTLVFFAAFGLLLLLKKQWTLSASILLGFAFTVFLIQALPDWLIWGKPFAELIAYFDYNASDARFDYAKDLGNSSSLGYLAVLSLLTLPIAGFFWFFGFLKTFKSHYLLFVPTLAFLAFHMSYVNVQERFVFPILPFVLMLGVIGWDAFRENSSFWKNRAQVWRSILSVSWVLNSVLLLLLSTYFGKKSRVTSMEALYNHPEVEAIIQENTTDGYLPVLPFFYAKRWDLKVKEIRNYSDYDAAQEALRYKTIWLYFQGNENIEERIEMAKFHFPNMSLVGEFHGSLLDRIIQRINPVNRNETIVVYACSGY